MFYLIFSNNLMPDEIFIKKFDNIGLLHRYINKHNIKTYRICERLSIFL